jgi:hypothetical protein
MNIGFYIDSLKGEQETVDLYQSLNRLTENDEVSDVSLFYNAADFNPEQPKFGVFNSTEIWCFTGALIATSLANAAIASNVINKFDLYYLYNKNDKDVFQLISLPKSVPILAKTEEDAKYIFRVSGKPVHSVVNNVEEIIGAVKND